MRPRARRSSAARCDAWPQATFPRPKATYKTATFSTRRGPNGGGAAMRGDSIAAVWPTLEVIRDIYSQASQGVRLTWVTLWDLEAAFRLAAYKRIAFKVA